MNEQIKQPSSSVPPQGEVDVVALIKKIQSHLVILERKIDSLLEKPQERPFKERHFSKPFRPAYSHSPRQGKGDYDKPREGNFFQGRPFKKHQRDEGQGYSHKKKPFFHKRKDR